MGWAFRAVAAASIFVSIISSPARGFAQTLPRIEAFAQLPNIESPRISPDGKHFAAIQGIAGKRAAVIYQVGAAPSAEPVIIRSDDWFIEAVKWIKNDRLVVFEAQNKKHFWTGGKLYTWRRAVAVDVDGKNPAVLLGENPSIMFNLGAVNIVDSDITDPNDVFMPLWIYSDMRGPDEVARDLTSGDPDYQKLFIYDLYRVDSRSGKGVRVAGGNRHEYGWYLDGSGHIVARVDETKRPLVDHLMLYSDENSREAGSFDADADKGADVVGLTEDGKALVRYARDAQSMRTLLQLDLASGKESVLYANPNYDVGHAIRDEWTLRVIGVSYDADSEVTVYFDPEREALQRGLEKAFPGMNVEVTSVDLAQDKVIVAVDTPRTPPTYYFLDRARHQATKIAAAYPGMNEADLGEMKPYAYKARDGLSIPAYLTLPPGRVAKNLPTVVMPHGGPDQRVGMGFGWAAQFLADRGYAVLEPNYRGSFGYGHRFTEAGLHQWGLKMQDDITDGVKKMIVEGIADPKRICIVGYDYGGYAALAGAAFTPDLYACAVSIAGISDLPEMIHEVRSRYGRDSKGLSFWISRIGDPDDDSDQLRATSPARHADRVKSPVLLNSR